MLGAVDVTGFDYCGAAWCGADLVLGHAASPTGDCAGVQCGGLMPGHWCGVSLGVLCAGAVAGPVLRAGVPVVWCRLAAGDYRGVVTGGIYPGGLLAGVLSCRGLVRGCVAAGLSCPGLCVPGAIDSGLLPGQVKGSRTMLAGCSQPHDESTQQKSPGRDDLGLGFGDRKCPMCQSLAGSCVCFQHLFGGVHVLPVSVDFDGLDFSALFPFPDLFWGDGDVEVFVHERDELFQGHGVAGLLVGVVALILIPLGVAVDL